MTRLHPSQLAGLAPDVTQPRYARTNLHPGIVHLGTGAFHRGRLAAVNEAAIHASDDLRWGTVGVALQTPDLCDTLAPQARLYTVTLRDIAQDGSPRETVQVVGNLMDVLFAPDNPVAVMERIAHPDTRIVSLTIAGESKSKSESDPHDPAVGSPGSPGRPAWSHGGARFVEHARPFEILKLRMVDGGHSALAYLGAMASLGTVDCVLAVPTFHRYLSGLMREEIAPTLPPLLDLDLNDYRSRLLDRLANPALQHQTHQIAANGSQKVPRRLLDTVRDRLVRPSAVRPPGVGRGRVDSLPGRRRRNRLTPCHPRSAGRTTGAHDRRHLGARPDSGLHRLQTGVRRLGATSALRHRSGTPCVVVAGLRRDQYP